MIEINTWIIVQLLNFLLLVIVLNEILFKPYLRLFRERQENTTGALERAKEMDREKDKLLEQIDARISEARGKASLEFEELRKEGSEIQRTNIDEANGEAVEINRKAKANLETAAQQARDSLSSDIEFFSSRIIEKLVKA